MNIQQPLAGAQPGPPLDAGGAGALVEDLRARVEAHLHGVLPGEEFPRRIVRELLLAGGKRLRPLLVHLGGRLVSAPDSALDELAAAAELVHVASLLHDDLMDGAEQRRGLVTAWRAHGATPAVLAGDLAYVHALGLVQPISERALARFVDTIGQMVVSQSLELEICGSLDGGVQRWEQVALGKTAALCAWCAQAGALMADRPQAAELLESYGQQLGLAFQAVDDLLDLVPGMDPGKAALADLRAGVPSLPIRFAAAADAGIRGEILDAWRQDDDVQPELAGAVLRLGGPPCAHYARGRLQAAHLALSTFEESPARQVLDGLLDTLLQRARRAESSILAVETNS